MASSSSSSTGASSEQGKESIDYEMDWMPPPPEYKGNRFFIKMKENPFVPIGLVATVIALSTGLFAFKKGNMAMSQNMMRLRVVAQGSTIMALLAGMAMAVAARNKSS